ncbi:uncharacterized protein LOC130168229 isoform X2 [Seriola aureovittata]|uniref:uncharacterized protein LOC130168229 isoform X2 n=1 Tax=Seriola aureovittata TaxID=2871759 RepID=UPI0024BDFADE|nr:uncharacterized protein LOC130168229 isoform X2 [Seriola aureovittata]
MMISVHFTLLFLWVTQDFGSCVNMKIPTDFLTVVLGDSLTLNCTYNCSNGFIRGCWSKTPGNSVCHGTQSSSTFCTTSLHLSNVSAEDLKTSYTCYTQDTDDPQLSQKTERIVSLQLEAQTSAPNWTVTPMTETKNGEPVLSRSSSPQPSHAVFSPVKGSLSTHSERVTLRIPTPDNESDTEVPYADIMIAARGVSTPELTQVCYLTPGDQKEWWGDESRSYLQASRSADRLHVPMPREVSRKMSTNSEYAVITYA